MEQPNRALTAHEMRLVRWMLMNGSTEATALLAQLQEAEVTPERCECGCASIYFRIRGYPPAADGISPVAEFVFGAAGSESGIFVFASGGILSGVEVFGLDGEASSVLPEPWELRPWSPNDRA